MLLRACGSGSIQCLFDVFFFFFFFIVFFFFFFVVVFFFYIYYFLPRAELCKRRCSPLRSEKGGIGRPVKSPPRKEHFFMG